MNNQVNAFIEQKKLKLSVKKCVKIHIGAKCKECEKLLVHVTVVLGHNWADFGFF